MRTPRHSPPPQPPSVPTPADVSSALMQRRYSQEERSPASRLVTGYLSQMAGPASTSTPTEEDDDEEREGCGGGTGYARDSGHYRPYHPERSEGDETAAGSGHSASRRKRQGVEKYVSDSSQLNLQFERRRSATSHHRPHQSGSDLYGQHHYHHYHQDSHSPLRYRSSVATPPSADGLMMYSATAYVTESRVRPSLATGAGSSSSLSPGVAEAYEVSRVRSSPALSAGPPPPSSSSSSSTTAGRFPFHYTPHPPSGTPPTLRELDAR